MLDWTYQSNYRFFFWVSFQQVVKKPQLVIQEIHNVVCSCEKKNAAANAAQMANIATADLIINLNCFICFHLSCSLETVELHNCYVLILWTHLHHETSLLNTSAVLLFCAEFINNEERSIRKWIKLLPIPMWCERLRREIDDGLFGNLIVVASHIFLIRCYWSPKQHNFFAIGFKLIDWGIFSWIEIQWAFNSAGEWAKWCLIGQHYERKCSQGISTHFLLSISSSRRMLKRLLIDDRKVVNRDFVFIILWVGN